MFIAGERFKVGKGVPANLEMTILYYKLGAILGDDVAQLKYADAIMHDRGGPKGEHEAVHFYQLAANGESTAGARRDVPDRMQWRGAGRPAEGEGALQGRS
jgi:TPR repeat protein